jgi:prepilin-type N-terminal cleavage/methylation domain-containing protein
MNRRGFTLIEIMIALVILAIAILGMATATAQFMHVVTVGNTRAAATQLAQQRIEQVLMDPNYSAIDTAYGKTETNFPGMTGYVRITTIQWVKDSLDYKRITVRVIPPTGKDTVKRTVMVAAP